MEKMKPLLISDGAERAQREIDEHRNRARLMTELIQAYNRLPHLGDIDTAIEAREFLSNPIIYLNTSIDNQLATGTFTGKVRPEAGKVAELYSIPYVPMLQRINMMSPHLRNLDRFGFDEEARTLVLLPEGAEQIKESCKIYLTREAEIELYQNIQEVCDKLNALSDLFGLGNIDLNQVPRALNFISCVGKKEGKGYELVPSVDRIKTHITKESHKF